MSVRSPRTDSRKHKASSTNSNEFVSEISADLEGMRLVNEDIKASHPSAWLRVSNVVGLLVFGLFQILFDTTKFGVSDLEMASRFPTPLTPAIWAFTIRVAIFAIQLVGVVYQALPYGYKSDGMKQRYVNGIGYGWQIAWVAEILWQGLFMLDSTIGIALCLACVVVALLAMGRTLYNMYRLKQEFGSLSNVLMYAAFFLPSSVHTAWLSMTAANAVLMIPAALEYGATLEVGAAILAIIVTSVGVYIVQTQRDSAYGLTLVWVLVAVYGQQTAAVIRVVSVICICIAILASIFSMLRRKNQGAAESAEVRQPLSRMDKV